MDSSDKLYFDKILTSLDGISSSLEGGAGTPETVIGRISNIEFGEAVYVGETGVQHITQFPINNISVVKNSLLAVSGTSGKFSGEENAELICIIGDTKFYYITQDFWIYGSGIE